MRRSAYVVLFPDIKDINVVATVFEERYKDSNRTLRNRMVLDWSSWAPEMEKTYMSSKSKPCYQIEHMSWQIHGSHKT